MNVKKYILTQECKLFLESLLKDNLNTLQIAKLKNADLLTHGFDDLGLKNIEQNDGWTSSEKKITYKVNLLMILSHEERFHHVLEQFFKNPNVRVGLLCQANLNDCFHFEELLDLKDKNIKTMLQKYSDFDYLFQSKYKPRI